MGATTDWRPSFVASAALMLRVKAKKKWPGWSDTDQEAAKTACLQAAADIEGIPDLRARAEAAEQRAEAAEAEAARLRSDRSALIVAALVGSNVGRTLPLHCRPMLDRLAAEVVAIVGADDREALGAYVEALLLAEAQPGGEVSR